MFCLRSSKLERGGSFVSPTVVCLCCYSVKFATVSSGGRCGRDELCVRDGYEIVHYPEDH